MRVDAKIHHGIIALLLETGREVLRLREEGMLDPWLKTDADYSVVTQADLRASEILVNGLGALLPGVKIISEEDKDHSATGEYDTAIIIDPIDGTRNFKNGGPHFGILVGIVINQVPVHGYVYCPDPRCAKLYVTDPETQSAKRFTVTYTPDGQAQLNDVLDIQTHFSTAALRVAQDFTDLSDILQTAYTLPAHTAPGSILAMLEGQVELAAGPHTMMDWDIAAVDAIARKAGAAFINVATGRPLVYGEARTQDRSFMLPRYVAGNEDTLRHIGLIRPTPVARP